eukprot:2083980-Amphidinium_carterae.2
MNLLNSARKNLRDKNERQRHIEALMQAGREITDSRDSMAAELREMQVRDLTGRENLAEVRRQFAQHNDTSF